MVNGSLLDHEFFMKKPAPRFVPQAPSYSGGYGRRTAGRSEKQSKLAVGSNVLEVGAWQSRSLAYATHRDGYREAGVQVEVFALRLSKVSVVAGSVRFLRPSFKTSPNAPDLSSGFPYMGMDESCLGFYSIYLSNPSVKYGIDCNRAFKKMSCVFNDERALRRDGRLTWRKSRPRSKFLHSPQLRTAIRPRIVE